MLPGLLYFQAMQHELKSVTVNKNMSWMNVFRSWCQAHHLENVAIETMAREELDKVLNKFYAEVKKRMEMIG